MKFVPLTFTTTREVYGWRMLYPNSTVVPVMRPQISHPPYALNSPLQEQWWREHCFPVPHYCCRWWEMQNAPDDPLAIGGLTNLDWELGRGEISLLVRYNRRGQGLEEQVAKCILEAGFGMMGLRSIVGESYQCAEDFFFWKEFLLGLEGKVHKTTLPHRKLWRGHYYPSLYFTIFPLILPEEFTEVVCEDSSRLSALPTISNLCGQ